MMPTCSSLSPIKASDMDISRRLQNKTELKMRDTADISNAVTKAAVNQHCGAVWFVILYSLDI